MKSEIYSNELKTVCNAVIQIGDIDDTGKGRHFVSKFIQDGLVKIEGHGIVLLKKETIDQSLQSMVGAPVIIKHQDVTNENADELRCGVISKAYFNDFDGWYYCEGIIWDEKAKELVNNGWSVSCSYDFLSYNDEGGVENNIKYDKEFTSLNFTHLALVNNPRYERANIVFNCKTDKKGQDKMILNALKDFISHIENERDSELGSDKGKWVTINGNHIFIRDGQTLGDAMDERGWGDKQADKSNSKETSKKEDWEFYYGDEKIGTSKIERDTKTGKGKTIEEKWEGKFSDKKDKQKAFGKGSSSETEKESNTTKDTRRHIDRIEKLIKKYNLEPHEEDELLDELGSFEAKLDENLEPREEEALREELFDFEDDIKLHQEMKKQEKSDTKKFKPNDKVDIRWFDNETKDFLTLRDATIQKEISEQEAGEIDPRYNYKNPTGEKYYSVKLDTGSEIPVPMSDIIGKSEGTERTKKSTDKQSDTKDKQSDVEKMYKVGSKFVQEDLYGKKEHTVKEVTKDLYGDTVVVDETGYQHHLNQIKPLTSKEVDKPKQEKSESKKFELKDYEKSLLKEGNTYFFAEKFVEKYPKEAKEIGLYKDKPIEYVNKYKGIIDWDEDTQTYTVWHKNGDKAFFDTDMKSKGYKTYNSKENDMKILDELKKLISRVENEKGEQDMDEKEKVDNENVDKRKLIDEVAGIMKSAGCDDEDIRTAIGKMEKIGYDKSEAGSADNKKVKNEEPDKKEDKEVDNEDAEDKKEAEDLEEDEKEDVKNKCKNSKSSFDKINEIYNSVKQVSEEKTFVSRQEKLDNAVEYFK